MSIPIIGQSPVLVGQGFTLQQWCITMVVQCQYCNQHASVLITGPAPGTCRCGAQFAIQGVLVDGKYLSLDAIGFAIAHGHPSRQSEGDIS